MNKGIIIEKHLKYSIVLTRDGSFEKAVIRESHADVGDEVHFKPYRKQHFFQKIYGRKLRWPVKSGLITALITILVFCSFYLTGGSKTYAYITIDINPSLEMQVDRFMQVQNISPMNEDAEQLISSLPLDEKTDFYAMVDQIMNICEESDLMSDEKNMLVGISYVDEEQKGMKNNIKQSLLSQETNWDIISFNIPPEIRERALENNTSMNKEFAFFYYDDKNLDRNVQIDEMKMERIYSFYYEEEEEIEEEQTESPKDNQKENDILFPVETIQEIRNLKEEKSADNHTEEKEDEIKASTTEINSLEVIEIDPENQSK